MKIQNYYKILELSPDSTTESLNEECRELFIKYHPDRNKTEEAAAKFMLVSDAYAVLLDKEIRKDYDYLLSNYSEEKPLEAIDRERVRKIKDLLTSKREVFKKMFKKEYSFMASLIGDLPGAFLEF